MKNRKPKSRKKAIGIYTSSLSNIRSFMPPGRRAYVQTTLQLNTHLAKRSSIYLAKQIRGIRVSEKMRQVAVLFG
jgi:hypothetical protein